MESKPEKQERTYRQIEGNYIFPGDFPGDIVLEEDDFTEEPVDAKESGLADKKIKDWEVLGK